MDPAMASIYFHHNYLFVKLQEVQQMSLMEEMEATQKQMKVKPL